MIFSHAIFGILWGVPGERKENKSEFLRVEGKKRACAYWVHFILFHFLKIYYQPFSSFFSFFLALLPFLIDTSKIVKDQELLKML